MEFAAVKTKLADLSTKLSEFLVKITTEELDVRKIDYAIATSEGLIREINQRIASLKR